MNRNITLLILGVLGLLLATSVVASSAFTTIEMDRDANINVTADANSLIALNAHEDSEVVTGTDTGALQIDFDPDNTESGVNVNSTYTVGNPDDAATTYAFSITNNNTAEMPITVSYEFADTVTDGDVTFKLYDSDGSHLNSVSSGSSSTPTLAEGETIYVVIEVTSAGDPMEDLSGTLTIEA